MVIFLEALCLKICDKRDKIKISVKMIFTRQCDLLVHCQKVHFVEKVSKKLESDKICYQLRWYIFWR